MKYFSQKRAYLVLVFATLLGSAACSQIPFLSSGTAPQGPPAASKTPNPNRDPIIRSLTAHRFMTASQSVTLWVQAFDPNCDLMKVSWSVTEGLLSSTVGTDVTLTAVATKSATYISTVQVSVSDGRGGTAQGSLNVQFGTDGSPVMQVEATASQPTPEPCTTPTPEPSATSAPAPTTSPSSSNNTSQGPIQLVHRRFAMPPGSWVFPWLDIRNTGSQWVGWPRASFNVSDPYLTLEVVPGGSLTYFWPSVDAGGGSRGSSSNFTLSLSKQAAPGYTIRIPLTFHDDQGRSVGTDVLSIVAAGGNGQQNWEPLD